MLLAVTQVFAAKFINCVLQIKQAQKNWIGQSFHEIFKEFEHRTIPNWSTVIRFNPRLCLCELQPARHQVARRMGGHRTCIRHGVLVFRSNQP